VIYLSVTGSFGSFFPDGRGLQDEKSMHFRTRDNSVLSNATEGVMGHSSANSGADLHQIESPRLVGRSAPVVAIREIADSIAARKCTVLILGETGTGKEMLARHVHCQSDRRHKPFVPVDCSSLTESLFESQLFGHLKGSFTGAVRDSLGFIRAAEGGTLFLDEIGELPLTMQAKLLRVIQERALVPVGDTKPRPVDVRIICATHRDLRTMVSEGTFREDLYFRLNVVSMHLPPLRERQADIVPLAEHFLASQAEAYDEPVRSLSAEAKELLLTYAWPGNVRELANAIEHAHVLGTSGTITPFDLPDRLITSQPERAIALKERGPNPSLELGDDLNLENLERRAIIEALRRTKNNKAAAARLLGVNIQRLGRMLERLDVHKESILL
jgi:transcriptional regulator with PAS, ATPase and Fis domain